MGSLSFDGANRAKVPVSPYVPYLVRPSPAPLVITKALSMDICEQIVYCRRSQAPLNCYNAPSHFTGQ
jgi:hypothetical protein